MNTNRFVMLVVAALITSATVSKASASMYDDAFSQDAQAVPAAVATKSAEVQDSRAAVLQALVRSTVRASLIIDSTGHYDTESDRTDTSNTMTIAPYGDGSIYFKIFRQARHGNGASCTINAIADYNAGTFVFRDKNASIFNDDRSKEDQHCRVILHPNEKGVTVETQGICQDYCGAAMELDSSKFNFHDRMPLGNIENVKQSYDYKDAVQNYTK